MNKSLLEKLYVLMEHGEYIESIDPDFLDRVVRLINRIQESVSTEITAKYEDTNIS